MMIDTTRIVKLVADGVTIGVGEKVSVFVTDVEAADVVDAFVAECYRRGAIAQVIATDERFDLSALRWADRETLLKPPPMEIAAMEWSDVHVSFRAMANPVLDADPERIAALRRGRGVVSTRRWEQTRWAIVRVPTRRWSDAMGLDHKRTLTEWAGSFDADWADAAQRMQAACNRFNGATSAVIEDDFGTLQMDLTDRTWVPFAGNANWPDGELAIAPVDDGSNGRIRFPGKFSFGGVVIVDLELDIEQGVIVAERAAAGGEFVCSLLDTDPGARRIGEFGIGTNAALQTMTGDLFLDEKILGTAHIAPGRAYPECGGINRSALHWDIVKDLRGSKSSPAGSLRLDDTWLIRDGVVQPVLAAAAIANDRPDNPA